MHQFTRQRPGPGGPIGRFGVGTGSQGGHSRAGSGDVYSMASICPCMRSPQLGAEIREPEPHQSYAATEDRFGPQNAKRDFLKEQQR